MSDANYEAALAVRDLSDEYEVIKKVIGYVNEFEKLSDIDLSDIFLQGDESVDKALEAIDKLDKQLADGKITREEYADSITEIKDGTLQFIDFVIANVPLASEQIAKTKEARARNSLTQETVTLQTWD